MHVHVGALEFFIFLANLIIAQFFLRQLAAKFSDTTWGKALGSIVG